MSDKKNTDQKSAKNIWDLAYHVMNKFPLIALTAALLIALYFGSELVLTQLNNADKELAKARGEIEELRKEAQKAYELARDREVQAANAVQEAMINTAERIQALITGQLDSMESLDKIRKATAEDIANKLNEFEEKQIEFEEELSRAEEKISLASLSFTLSQLEKQINANSSDAFDAVQLVAEALSKDDKLAEEEVLKEINRTENLDFAGALWIAMYLNLPSEENVANVINFYERNWTGLNADILDSMIGCCEDEKESIVQFLFPVIAQSLFVEDIDYDIRLVAVGASVNFPGIYERPILINKRHAEYHADAFEMSKFILVFLNDQEKIYDGYYDEAIALGDLDNFDPSAEHYVAYKVLEKFSPGTPQHKRASDVIAERTKTLPIFAQPPPANLIDFWSNITAYTDISEYKSLKINELYKYSED